MKDIGLVSIAIALYNREDFIRDTLCSLQVQTYSNFECIIVDDNSDDESVNIVYNEFCKKDKRFKLLTNCTSNKYVDAHNISYEMCKGKYLFRVDADDIFYPEYLERTIDFMEENPEYDAVCSIQRRCKKNNRLLEDVPYNDDKMFYDGISEEQVNTFNLCNQRGLLVNTYVWANPTSCIRKTSFDSFGIRYTSYEIGDYVFWWGILSMGGKLHVINEKHSISLVHNSCVSNDNKFYNVEHNIPVQKLLALYRYKAYTYSDEPDAKEATQVFKNTYDYFCNLENAS